MNKILIPHNKKTHVHILALPTPSLEDDAASSNTLPQTFSSTPKFWSEATVDPEVGKVVWQLE
jgi:hypothetical protein